MAPGRSAVGRPRPSDGGGSSGRNPPRLKRRYQRSTICQHVRLHFSCMLSRSNRIRIGADLRETLRRRIRRRREMG